MINIFTPSTIKGFKRCPNKDRCLRQNLETVKRSTLCQITEKEPWSHTNTDKFSYLMFSSLRDTKSSGPVLLLYGSQTGRGKTIQTGPLVGE